MPVHGNHAEGEGGGEAEQEGEEGGHGAQGVVGRQHPVGGQHLHRVNQLIEANFEILDGNFKTFFSNKPESALWDRQKEPDTNQKLPNCLELLS